ncbi:transmembrane protein 56-B isoform X3 [Vigna radiata var. radiata]|uniref:Transmembrane protein 56-B isoform X3 n=1 Tax=Vigna radiata var. radiata TaxID=3916 RepID=A0A3Q0FJH9_VIGRR|nr:transmembrane protein 56-B isoform X3 [Vigna radiata var. radiata]
MTSDENMTFKSYQDRANLFVKEYLLADSLIPYTSVISGMLACKMVFTFVFDLTQFLGSNYFKIHSNFSKVQRIEWNNRAVSTTHAIFITTISLYLVFCSSLFRDNPSSELITVRRSTLSTFALGVIHHLLSLVAVAYSMLSGEGQLYTFMVLISETTTPGINLRWYLDVAGMKKSRAYLINGIVIFISWLVARILLFIYMFYHVYLHFDQVEQMHPFGQILVVAVPVVLSVMNLVWFAKIIKGLRKTLAKRQ